MTAQPRCCICYTTDAGYVFPTFVSALQARQHASVDKADVVIFLFGAPQTIDADLATACETNGIKLVHRPLDVIDGAPVMLARLFLTHFVPAQYEQILYMDGDTQVHGLLDPLLDAVVPPGKFMAANDPMTFVLPGADRLSRDVAGHFASLGIPADKEYNYFNTGVLRISREGWEPLGAGAWKMFKAAGCTSRFPDQDVLNVIAGSDRIPMSLAWNFPIFMCNCQVQQIIAPRIYHFMSSPKPWQGPFQPWGFAATRPYREVIGRFPGLARYRDELPVFRRLRYHLQQGYKMVDETVSWRFTARRERILSYENSLSPLAESG
jgi:hypothetical protein